MTYQERPKFSAAIQFNPLGLRYDDVAIVIQGPVVAEEGFTLETVKLYLKNFSGVTVIVSTWDDTAAHLLQELRDAGALIEANEKPLHGGFININFQIVSSNKGLKRAKQLGKKYAVKSRSDQRLYNPFFLSAFQLLASSNTNATLAATGLKGRLIVGSMSTLKYRPYGITDMLMLGYTDDLLLYWPSNLDDRQVEMKAGLNVLDYAKLEVTETYLLTSFLRRVGTAPDFTLAQTWEIYKDLFMVLDKASFNVFWYKYSIEKENRLDYFDDHVYKELSFFEWASLSNHPVVPEEYLNREIPPYTP